MITLAYLLIFFDKVIYGNNVAIHSDELSGEIFLIVSFWIILIFVFFLIPHILPLEQ